MKGASSLSICPTTSRAKPTIVIKNVGGAGGVIGSNQLGEAAPNGETMGFFTLDTIGTSWAIRRMRTSYTDFVTDRRRGEPAGGLHARKDTPPGIKVATDIMKAHEFKALSLNIQSSNTVNQALMLDLLGVKYQAVPAFRGLKDVETAILQNQGQLAEYVAPGLDRLGRADHVRYRHSAVADFRRAGRTAGYPRSRALPDLPTFEEFYATVNGGKQPSGMLYEALRAGADPQLAMFRTAVMPPKVPEEAVNVMRSAFVELWQDAAFIRDYSNIIKTDPVLVTGHEAQAIFAELGNIKPQIKSFITEYSNRLVK